MSELEKVANLRRTVDAAKQEQAKREALADQAEGIAVKALADLAVLGYSSPEEALAEAARIRRTTEGAVSQIEKEIQEAIRG